ncbi:MAG: serine hydrolase domain-containing protein [Polyangiales bacterium]
MAFDTASHRTIEQILGKAKVPGAVVARVRSTGIDAITSFGYADLSERRATTTDAAFHLYSGTKLFTASALMLLSEQGKVDLDADIRPLFPEADFDKGVTARQLASHSSGLPDTLRAFFAVHFPGEPRPSTDDALQRYRLAGGKTPGRTAEYRNVNYAILGELIARSAETTYEDFVQRSLLDPWGSNAKFESGLATGLATGYVRRFSLMPLVCRFLIGKRGTHVFNEHVGSYLSLRPFDLDTAATGGLIGCAADFAPMVAEFVSDRNGVLRADTRRSMLEQVARGAAGIASTSGVGIGWKHGKWNGCEFWNHEGGGPGYCSELRIYPRQQIGFVILMNLSQSRGLSWMCHELCEQLRK